MGQPAHQHAQHITTPTRRLGNFFGCRAATFSSLSLFKGVVVCCACWCASARLTGIGGARRALFPTPQHVATPPLETQKGASARGVLSLPLIKGWSEHTSRGGQCPL